MAETVLVRRLAGVPRFFDALRWILEGGYRGHHRVISTLVANHGRMLDLGCGTGIYAPFFPANGYVGIDITPAYITAAKEKFPGYRFEVQDATKLSFAAGEFDACMIS